MTLQTLLLKLGNNKNYSIECYPCDGRLHISVKEMFWFNEIASVYIDLRLKLSEQQDEIDKLLPYIKK